MASLENQMCIRDRGNPNNPKGTDKRMHYIVYEPDPDKTKAIPVPRRMWITFQDDEKTDTRDNRRKIKENLMRSEGDPVFYLLDDDKNLVYFGTTMLFRLPYPRSIKEFVPDHLRDCLLYTSNSKTTKP